MKAHIKQQSHFMPTPDRDHSIFRPSSTVLAWTFFRSERTNCTVRTALERFSLGAVQLLGILRRFFLEEGRREVFAPGRKVSRLSLDSRRHLNALHEDGNRKRSDCANCAICSHKSFQRAFPDLS